MIFKGDLERDFVAQDGDVEIPRKEAVA